MIVKLDYFPNFRGENSKNIWVGNHQAVYGGFPSIVVPQNGWFMKKNPIKMDDLGEPPFMETPVSMYRKYQTWSGRYLWHPNPGCQGTGIDNSSKVKTCAIGTSRCGFFHAWCMGHGPWCMERYTWNPQTTIFLNGCLVSSNHFLYIKIWNHPIETTIYKYAFGVPGIYIYTSYKNFEKVSQKILTPPPEPLLTNRLLT